MKHYIAEIIRSSETFEDIFRIGYVEAGNSKILVQFVGITEEIIKLLKVISRTIDARNRVVRL